MKFQMLSKKFTLEICLIVIKVLFVITKRIGDALSVTPAIRSVYKHYPNCEITVYCKNNLTDLFEDNPYVKNIKVFSSSKAKLLSIIQFRKIFDKCFFYSENKSFFGLAIKNSKNVFAFDSPYLKKIDNVEIIRRFLPEQRPHIIIENLELISRANINLNGTQMDYYLSEEDVAYQNNFFQRIRQGNEKIFCLKIMSDPGKKFRDWSLNRFSELILLILENYAFSQVLIVGSSSEKLAANKLCSIYPERVHAFCNQSLSQTAAIVFGSDFYIGVDTGITQIASCSNKPMIGLYHCLIGKRKAGPLNNKLDYSIDMPTPEEGCLRKEGTMDIISAKEVFLKINKVLAK